VIVLMARKPDPRPARTVPGGAPGQKKPSALGE
jgi:hypothetical protein